MTPALKKTFERAAWSLAALFACAGPVGYSGPHFGWQNRRFATCLAQQTGGKAQAFGVITDLDGETVMVDPVLKTYGTGLAGRRPGVTVAALNAPDKLTYVLHKDASGHFAGHWDFARVAGIPLRSGTKGWGKVVPSARQIGMAQFADYCANNPWVNSNAGGVYEFP